MVSLELAPAKCRRPYTTMGRSMARLPRTRAAAPHLLAPLCLLLAAAAAAAASAHLPRRALQGRPNVPLGRYDRAPMTGRARGVRAAGEPAPVQGLVSADVPQSGRYTASMEDLVLPWGYPLETYPVETLDGYVLRLYRIPHGKTAAGARKGPKPVVLLHHGVTLASSSFVVLDPDSSAAFFLADAGFDVWMANTRGNTYSRGNSRYSDMDPAFWSFGLDELALVDLPAQIDYVLNATGQASLAIVGHSQGCTLPEMLLAEQPEYNDKVWLLALLGPVTFGQFIRAPFLQAQAETGSAQALLAGMGAGAFIPNTATAPMIQSCQFPMNTPFCFDLINFMFYGPSQEIDYADYMRVGATWPSTVSTRNLVHWSQMAQAASGLRRFDYGANCSRVAAGASDGPAPFQESCNQAKYGQALPPRYELGNIKAKAAVFQAGNDQMATSDDVSLLLATWGADVRSVITYEGGAHMDFVWARNPKYKMDLIKQLWRHAPKA